MNPVSAWRETSRGVGRSLRIADVTDDHRKRLTEAHAALRERRYEDAAKAFTMLFDEGHPEAGLGLGWLYAHGVGVEEDFERAEHVLRAAVEAGNDGGLYQLGRLYLRNGFPENAFAQFSEGARRNDLPSLYWTGWAYLKGMGTEKDLSKAEACLKSAADRGHVFAARELATARYRGTFGPPDRIGGAIAVLRAIIRGVTLILTDPYGARTR